LFLGPVSGSVAHRAQLKGSIAPPNSDQPSHAQVTAREPVGAEVSGQDSKSAVMLSQRLSGRIPSNSVKFQLFRSDLLPDATDMLEGKY
jgi:hypothetical protein